MLKYCLPKGERILVIFTDDGKYWVVRRHKATLFGRAQGEIPRSAIFGNMGHFRTFTLVIWDILGHLMLTRLKYPYMMSPSLSMILGLSF